MKEFDFSPDAPLHQILGDSCRVIDGVAWQMMEKSDSLADVGMDNLAKELASMSAILRESTDAIMRAYSQDLSGQVREQEQGMGRILGALLNRHEPA